jgi:3-hydroxyisobutyrate dehydrogenase
MNTSSPGPVGFIGLGNMGWPMAANLARAGFKLLVCDADHARQDDFAAEFGAVSTDGPAAFSGAEAVVTMLPNGAVVREAILDSGVAGALPDRALVIDTSSAAPSQTIELRADLAELGIALVDAPVSGGVARATDGTLSIMLGAGDEAVAERACRVLGAMSARIFRTGGLGTGHAMKALNNYVFAAGFAAASEALIIGGKFGLDPAVVADVLNVSSGRNVATETILPGEVLPRRFEAHFSLGLLSKDVGIADDLARETDIDAPVCGAVRQGLDQAADVLGWNADYTEVVRLWERHAGIELPARSSGTSTQGSI